MLKSKKATIYLCIAVLACTTLVAGIKNPEPISGLNIEDFQGASKKSEPNWQSNPFVKYNDTPQTKQLTLYGIILGKNKSLALINNEIVHVGDKLGTSEVVAIQKQKVILRNSDGLFQISFRGTPNDKT